VGSGRIAVSSAGLTAVDEIFACRELHLE